MTRFPALSFALGLTVAFTFACAGDDIGLGSGDMTIHNDDDIHWELRISDTEDCVIGMNSSINVEATRHFDVMKEGVDEGQSWVCLIHPETDEKSDAIELEDGQHLVIRGGELEEDTTYEDY